MLGRSASTSGRSMAALSTLPRSPPVMVATRTSAPSLTYLAIVAAPLLDSSSGCACTAMRRSFASAARPCPDPWDDTLVSIRLFSLLRPQHLQRNAHPVYLHSRRERWVGGFLDHTPPTGST